MATDPGAAFKLPLARRGEALITRDGRPVKFIAHEPALAGRRSVLAIVDGELHLYDIQGRNEDAAVESPLDLFMAPRVMQLWVRSVAERDGTHRVEWTATPAGVAPKWAPNAVERRAPFLFDTYNVAVEE